MPRRVVAAVSGAALLLQACAASMATPNFREGEEYLRAAPHGVAGRLAEPLRTTEPIRTLAILMAGDEAPYLPNWNPRTAFADATGREGMGVGFWAGMNLVSMLPLLAATPPVIGGIIGLATVVGGISGATQAGKGHWKPTADHQALEAALGRLRPQAEVRDRFREEVERITRRPAPLVARAADEPSSQAPDYAALARGVGADAVADLRVVSFGLAGGEMAFSLGVFAGVRARVFRAADGALIYDKVIAQSPEAPLQDAPPPGSYTLDLMAMDDARAFRHEVGQAIKAIARALATDPDLRLAPAPGPEPASR